MSNKNFLEVDDRLLKSKLLLSDFKEEIGGGDAPSLGMGISHPNMHQPILTPSQKQEASQCKFIIPEPGKCVKTTDKKSSQKVFMNICHSDKVPEPLLNFTDQQLSNILTDGTDDEVDDVRIPISIGEKRVDADKGGAPCQVYDIIVNTNFYNEKVLNSKLYFTFLCVVSIEALDEKYKLELDRNNYIVMKHKACYGKLQPQFVRSKPAIREVSSTTFDSDSEGGPKPKLMKKPLIEVVSSKNNEEEAPAALNLDPDKKLIVKIFQYRSKEIEGVATIEIPGLKDLTGVSLHYESDEIKITSPVGRAHVKVPVNIDPAKSRHVFNSKAEKIIVYLRFRRVEEATLAEWTKHGHDIYAYEDKYKANMTLHNRVKFSEEDSE